ncbi:hypothetical protein Tco_1521167, partial [Tanacetum coccineum]
MLAPGPYDMTLVQLEDTLLDDENQRRLGSVHIILNGIGESINIQDVKTKLFWEIGKFTSRVRESIELYCTKFY